VGRNPEGKPESVRYEQINAMLLNEFLKEHGTVQELKSTAAKQNATVANLDSMVAQQQNETRALTTTVKEQAVQIQKVSAQIEANKPDTKMVSNRP
jgi:primosomal protein N''